MTEPTPTFAGEVQFRRYSDTSTQGTQIVLALPDREALQSFIGLEGKRFMVALVLIGDDEQPVPANPLISKQNANSRLGEKVEKSHLNREPLGDLCWRAVQWCKEPEFCAWINSVTHNGVFWHVQTHEDAREFVCEMCDVQSRKELDTNPEAASKFNKLIRGPYQKHLIARGIVR
jgi:hypothetical protein